MKMQLKVRAREILSALRVDSDRIETPLLFQPNLKNRKPPRVVRPSQAIQKIIRVHNAMTKG